MAIQLDVTPPGRKWQLNDGTIPTGIPLYGFHVMALAGGAAAAGMFGFFFDSKHERDTEAARVFGVGHGRQTVTLFDAVAQATPFVPKVDWKRFDPQPLAAAAEQPPQEPHE